jgi:hypothetical protein
VNGKITLPQPIYQRNGIKMILEIAVVYITSFSENIWRNTSQQTMELVIAPRANSFSSGTC